MAHKLKVMNRQFKAALQPSGVLEILIYDEIGESWYSEGITAKSVRNTIDLAGAFESISLRINSPGGDAFEGAAIYSVLAALGKPVNVIVDGLAASAASIIAMAGTKITMSPVAMMMVHNAWGFCVGNADDMRQTADALEKISLSIGQAYVKRTGKTIEEIAAIMDAETWMGAQECVDQGFATDVAEPAPLDAPAMALAASFKSLSKMKHVPQQLKAAAVAPKGDASACTCDCVACVDGDCANCVGCDLESCDNESCGPEEGEQASNLSLYEARLAIVQHTQPQA